MNTSPVSASLPRRQAQCNARSRGLTLIELLIVIVIVSLLAGTAGPSLAALVDAMRMRTIANDFLASLYLARSEAVKRNTRVALCKSADSETCSSASTWDQGWITFHDPNNNGRADAGEAIVQRYPKLPRGFVLRGNLPVARYISFSPLGGTRTIGGGFQAGTITLCLAKLPAREGRAVVINNVGRMRVEKAAANRCE